WWAGRLDVSAQKGTWGFRLIILPGAIALWPALARKTWWALHGRYVAPAAEQPVPPSRLRRIHGWYFRVLVVVVPVLCAAALITRPPAAPAQSGWNPAKPFPQVVSVHPLAVVGLPVTVQLRTDGTDLQALLKVSAALPEPVVALYWSPEPAATALPRDAVFLGSVWGPADLPMLLPAGAASDEGTLYFLSLSDGQRLLGAVSLGAQ
ncbi:MAG: hypothetical protein ABSH19_06900, partial [Opitutales bacterium]